jgi:hypothetical protein
MDRGLININLGCCVMSGVCFARLRKMTDLLQARQLLADAITVEIDVVPDNARIGDFERWDSLVHMRLLLFPESSVV